MSQSRLVAILAICIMVSACGGASQSETTVEITQTTTVAPTTTAIAAATTTTPAQSTCPDAEISTEVEMGEQYAMDLDGDGAVDTLTVFFDPTGNFGLLVEYASGGSARIDRPIFAGRHPIIPIGLFDVNDDGTAELFLIEYLAEEGLSYEPGFFNRVIIAQPGPCSLSVTRNADTDSDASFHLSAYPPQGSHLTCDGGLLLIHDFYTEDAEAFRVNILPYELSDGEWTRGDTVIEMVAKSEMLARALFDCGGLGLPDPVPAG